MKKRNPQLFLSVPGKRVPVEKDVYDAWWNMENKEDYFVRKLKEERFIYDPEKGIAEIIPSREDSLERLMDEGAEFAMEQPSVEHQAEVRILMESILERLSEDEKRFMGLAFFSDMTEVDVSKMLNTPLSTFRDRKEAFLVRCRKILNSPAKWNDSS